MKSVRHCMGAMWAMLASQAGTWQLTMNCLETAMSDKAPFADTSFLHTTSFMPVEFIMLFPLITGLR